MSVSGSLVSLVLGAFCLVLDLLGLAGRAIGAGLDVAKRPAAEGGLAHPVRTIAVTVVTLVAALVVIQLTAELIEGYNTRHYSPPEAFDANRPARQGHEPGRAIRRAQLGEVLADSD